MKVFIYAVLQKENLKIKLLIENAIADQIYNQMHVYRDQIDTEIDTERDNSTRSIIFLNNIM